MDELKPCPFCGGEADEHRDRGPTGELYVWVGCNDCDATSACVDERSMQPEESDAQSLWNTRAEASIAEPVAWMHHHPKVPGAAFKTPLPRGADELGWTETPLYAHPPAAPDTVTLDRALVEEALVALRLLQSYGCPACSGDCASANPPMIVCPMAGSQAAIFRLTEALK